MIFDKLFSVRCGLLLTFASSSASEAVDPGLVTDGPVPEPEGAVGGRLHVGAAVEVGGDDGRIIVLVHAVAAARSMGVVPG